MSYDTNVFAPSPATAYSRFARLAGITVSLLLLVACASRPAGENTVEQRAQARWDALLSGDYETAYALYSPGYRSAFSRVDFEIAMRTRRIAWIAASVQDSQCETDACTVTTKVRYRVGSPVPGIPKWESDRLMPERWVRTGGQWWFVPES